jgi:ribosomal protein S18 acetylase RimI-like enzyme
MSGLHATAKMIQIRPLSQADAQDAARLHMAGQPGTFLTQLGGAVLETIYTALPGAGFGFVATGPTSATSGAPSIWGYISGAPGIGRLFAHMLTANAGRTGIRLMGLLARRVARRPHLLIHTMETLLYPLKSRAGHSPVASQVQLGAGKPVQHDAPRLTIELLSIMVEPAVRNRGIGGQLLAAFVDECRIRTASAIEVTVDAANQGACRFYEKHGFVPVRDFRLYGRAMRLYQRTVS